MTAPVIDLRTSDDLLRNALEAELLEALARAEMDRRYHANGFVRDEASVRAWVASRDRLSAARAAHQRARFWELEGQK